MRKFTPLFIAITVSLLPLSLLSMSSVLADDVFTMDDISESLQMEYQGQLILQPQTKRKVQPRKVVVKSLQLDSNLKHNRELCHP